MGGWRRDGTLQRDDVFYAEGVLSNALSNARDEARVHTGASFSTADERQPRQNSDERGEES